MSKPKIVIDARESGTSTGRYIDKLLEKLNQLDTDYKIIALTKKHRMEYLKTVAPRLEIIESNYKEFTFGEQLGFLWQLLSLKPDLVHFGMVQQPVAYRGKTVTTMHDLITLRFHNPSKNKLVFRTKQKIYRWVNYIAARKATAIITPTEYVKDDVAKHLHINSRKIFVTYEAGTKIEDAPEELPEMVDKKFIMYVGRPMPHKNLDRLVDAFQILQEKHPDLQLVLAGKTDPVFERHAKRVKRKGVTNVHFTGYISDGQLRWLLENCRAYVFPSLSEGFGLPGLEAMAHGAPVVSSNASCLPEVYQGAAYYFDPKNTEEMAKKINDVLTKPKLRDELIEAGRIHASSFSWKRMARQTLAVYKQSLEK